MIFCVQAEDGIRVAQESRGLGDVYKRQALAVARQGRGVNFKKHGLLLWGIQKSGSDLSVSGIGIFQGWRPCRQRDAQIETALLKLTV